MTRTIRLTRIHALNWYGYKDTIPVEGNLLLAGVTGSGKSILMDLIQFVLVGDQRLIRFNQSATGDRSDRSLKGYSSNSVFGCKRRCSVCENRTIIADENPHESGRTIRNGGHRRYANALAGKMDGLVRTNAQ